MFVGGSDGMVNTWDGFNRKWLGQFEKYPSTISSLDFSEDGNQLAIASSYIYEFGVTPDDQPSPEPAIFIRSIADSEVKRKQVPATAAPLTSTTTAVPPVR